MPDKKPNLGLATTRELLIEIKARGEISATIGDYPQETGDMAIGAANLLESLPGSVLDYKTVNTELVQNITVHHEQEGTFAQGYSAGLRDGANGYAGRP